MSDESVFSPGGDEVDDGQPYAPDGGAGIDDESDSHVGQDAAGEGSAFHADSPGALHAQVGVQGVAVVEPGQEVLAMGVVLEDPPPRDFSAGSVSGANLSVGKRVPVECRAEAGCQLVDAVALRHTHPRPQARVSPGKHLDD